MDFLNRSVLPFSELSLLDEKDWMDWRWQQKNTIKNIENLVSLELIDINSSLFKAIKHNSISQKIQITPYYINLIKSQKNDSIKKRLLNQVIPYWNEELEDGYNGHTENWELSHEMKTPICQHKYDNRVIIRTTNVCNSYCQFCFEALRTINKDNSKPSFNISHWRDTCEYITNTPSIEEVVFSGGDPLMLSDDKLRQCLLDIRAIRPELLIRLHTRALTFNPYRITNELIETFSDVNLNSFGVHICHPAEITDDFIKATKKVRSAVPILFANIPVLKNINNSYNTLSDLFLSLYRNGIVPYYLYHFMPFSPGSSEYRASVSDIIEIMSKIKRHKSNIAVPEYVLPHARGKFTVPLISDPNDYPKFEKKEGGKKSYHFTNWLGERHEWMEI